MPDLTNPQEVRTLAHELVDVHVKLSWFAAFARTPECEAAGPAAEVSAEHIAELAANFAQAQESVQHALRLLPAEVGAQRLIEHARPLTDHESRSAVELADELMSPDFDFVLVTLMKLTDSVRLIDDAELGQRLRGPLVAAVAACPAVDSRSPIAALAGKVAGERGPVTLLRQVQRAHEHAVTVERFLAQNSAAAISDADLDVAQLIGRVSGITSNAGQAVENLAKLAGVELRTPATTQAPQVDPAEAERALKYLVARPFTRLAARAATVLDPQSPVIANLHTAGGYEPNTVLAQAALRRVTSDFRDTHRDPSNGVA